VYVVVTYELLFEYTYTVTAAGKRSGDECTLFSVVIVVDLRVVVEVEEAVALARSLVGTGI